MLFSAQDISENWYLEFEELQKLKQMYVQHSDPPFKRPLFYIILDALFLLFSILYNIGDSDHANNFLKYTKPIPLWILIAQLWSLRAVNCNIYIIIWGIALGSVGDIFLLFGVFEAGAGFFLLGHVFDVYAFVAITREIAENRVGISEVMRQGWFIGLWIVLMTFSFWSISLIIRYIALPSIMPFILSLYGSVLIMLTMAGLFFFFVTYKILNPYIFKAGLCLMIGSLVFLASDNFLAHGKFNTHYPITPFWNSFLIMITYYVAQFLIAKGTFFASIFLNQNGQTQNFSDVIEER